MRSSDTAERKWGIVKYGEKRWIELYPRWEKKL